MSFFEIFAECSIALAGFGAVHAVLRGSTSPRGVLRAWATVVYGALCFLLSALPLVLALTSLSGERLWRSASAFGVAGAAAALYSVIVFDIRLARLGHPPDAPLGLRTAQLSSIIAILAMLANLIGWPWPSGPVLYATALVLILIIGLIALLLAFLVPLQLVLRGEPSEPPDDPPAT